MVMQSQVDSQHITKISMTEAMSPTVILYRTSLLLRVYYRITYSLFDYVMNLNGYTRINNTSILSL